MNCGNEPSQAQVPAQQMPADGAKPLIPRNFTLGVINGSFWLLARALTDPDTILPAFAVALMGSNPLYVGLLVSVVNAGWFWPPLLLTPAMATRRHRHTYYKVSAVARMFAIAAVWLSVKYLAGDSPGLAFAAIAGCYLLYTSGGGVGMVPFMSVVTDSVPAHLRGRFFARRFFFGGLMAFAAGFWVKWLLSDDSGLHFPDSYAYLFLVAVLVNFISLSVWWFAREPEHKVETRRLPLSRQLLRGLRRMRREPNFLRFTASRVLMAAAFGLVTPFLVPFAYRALGMGEAMVGLALSAGVLSESMLNILWGRLSAERGNRSLLVIAGAVQMGAIALLLAIPLLPALPLGRALGLQFDLRLAALLVVFAGVGAARSGQNTGQMAYLLELTPERTRAVYLATYYLAALPMAFMPLVTALLIGAAGHYLLAFWLGATAMLVDLWLYARLEPLRTGASAAHAQAP
ncbi:MAG: MFS transporter [Armatimonadota bacterium]